MTGLSAIGPYTNSYQAPVNFNGRNEFDGILTQASQEKKKSNTISKVLLGLGTLAAIAIGGVLLHNKKATKTAKNLADSIVDKITIQPKQTVQECIDNICVNRYITGKSAKESMEAFEKAGMFIQE